MTKLIFGCGYLGSRVARRWQAAGHEVFAITRSGERARELTAWGLRPIVADVLRPDSLTGLPRAETVLFSVGFDRTASDSIFDVYVAGLRDVLALLPDDTQRVIYISTTGVYGQTHGELVDEESPTEPMREGGRASLAAERVLTADRLGERAIILRLAGIYGPGRIPLAGAIERGEPIPSPPRGALNLIHVDDAAQVVVAAEQQAEVPRTYNVSDGHPVIRQEYYQELARLLGAPPPTFAPPGSAGPRLGRGGDKRISNARMLAELNVRLAYPTYREGLAAIVSQRK